MTKRKLSPAPTRKPKHVELINAIMTETTWLGTAEFQEVIEDKGLGQNGVLRNALINLLHLARDRKINMKDLVTNTLLGFYYQTTPGPDREPIKFLTDLIAVMDGDATVVRSGKP